MTSRVLETILTGRNLLSPVLTRASADVTAFDAKVAASQDKASTSAETSARAQTKAADQVVAANTRTAASSSDAAAKVTAANTRTAESASASSSKVVASNARAAESTRAFADVSESSAARAGVAWASLATKALPLVAVAAAVVTGKMAGDYQQLVTKLETTAGESKANLGMVSQGMLDMAGQVGISATELATGMYTVESAGYHGAAGLNVLKASAEGARQENADLGKVTDAVSTILHDYHLPASQAATVTSQLVTAVSHGKTTFDELTGSLHSVTPLASVLGVTIADVTGTLSAMTASGMSADQATQNMADTLRHLASPTSTMTAELAQLGITSSDLSDDLSHKGLAGTLQMVETAIVDHLDPATQKVLLPALNASKTAARDLQIMIGQMPPSLAKLSQGFLDGSVSLKDYRTDTRNLGGSQAAMGAQFMSLVTSSQGFNNELKKGGPAAQAVTSAMAKSFGTSSALNVALMTTGENAGATNAAISDIGKAAADNQGNIKGWDEVQGNLNQKLAQAGAEAKTLAIEAGQHLLPVLTNVVGWVGSTGLPAIGHLGSGIGDLVHWFTQLPGPIKAVAEVLGGMALANAVGVFSRIGTAVSSVKFAMGVFAASAKISMGQVSASFAEAKSASAFVQTLDGGTASRFTGALSGMGAAASTAAKGGFSALKSAGSGLISMFGGPWVVGLAAAAGAVYLINKSVEDHAKQVQAATASVQKWNEALTFGGGSQMAAAARHIDDVKAKIASLQEKIDAYNAAAAGGNARGGVGTLISQMKDLKTELDGGTQAWQKQLDAMTPVQEGQAKVALATDAVNKALASHNPDAAAAAYDQLRQANTFLAGETGKQAEAQKSANQQLQDAATLAIGARDAALGYKLSQLDLKSAIADVAKQQQDGTLKGDALTKAQLQLAQQAENVAVAAGAAAEAQAKSNGVTETGTLKNDAMLASLREAAKHLTGPALAAINGYIADLAKSTTGAAKARDAMANLGMTVDKLPGGHFIKIEAPTAKQMKDLHDLAYVTTTLPDGHVLVTADTHPAESEIRGMLNWARTQSIVLRSSMSDLNGSTSGTGRMGTYAAGGWTGPGGKYTPAGVVHANEFVVPSERVDALGGPAGVGALVGMPGYAAGGVVVPVSVDPRSIAAMHAQLSAASKAYSASMGSPGGTPSSVSGNAAIVQRVAGQYGWGSGSEWDALYRVIMRESGFRNTAQNPTSTAYGMFQFLNSTWAGYGVSKTSDPLFQAVAGLKYIQGRYGDPLGAYRHEQSMGWYQQGTNYVPADGPAYLHRGEAVVPAAVNQGRPFTPTGAPGYSSAPAARTSITVAAPPAPQVTVHFHVDGAEFRGMTRTEIDHAFGQLADTVHYAGA